MSREIKTRFVKVVALLAIVGSMLGGSLAKAYEEIDMSRYAAVAFSKATGKYGYAWNQSNYASAKSVAIAHCKTDDAEIVGWVQGGWVCLAIGEDNAYGVGWEFGTNSENLDAKKRSMDECHKQGQKVKTLVLLSSGDINPKVADFKERDPSVPDYRNMRAK